MVTDRDRMPQRNHQTIVPTGHVTGTCHVTRPTATTTTMMIRHRRQLRRRAHAAARERSLCRCLV